MIRFVASMVILAGAAGAEKPKSDVLGDTQAVLVTRGGQLGYGIWGDSGGLPSDDVIVVGAKPPPPLPPIVIKPTSMFPLEEAQSPKSKTSAVSGVPLFVEPPVPNGALRPDANNQILLPNRRPLDLAAASDGLKNPWGIRIAPASSITDYVLEAGMFLHGPKPIVSINGQGLIRGERVGSFTVAEIRRTEAVLEYDGTFFVIPERKKVTVRIPKQ